ncbi:histone-like nucleoid-structuring protein Lsr2 [Arthrobacter roseus]|uniref:histone-like nucleoid-structuring protein Lsr2 n=1 Tax=Arthrobacter roseus TaxID=136274 RepID=UPI00196282AB|nr:Lsr2 family protein [Arthrobacter roseus]MBM7847295.1 hypothetical protein [Arthrobacter roseus]
MAQKVEVILIDDLDEGHADETIRFGVDGSEYEIDLSSAHADEFRSAVRTYVDAARKISRAKSAPAATRNQDTAKIREWARKNGRKVSSRGRISADIAEAYRAAQGH